MLLVTVLVGVLWFQSQEVLSDFQCPEIANCSCSEGKKGDFELLCLETSNQPIATFLPNEYLRLQCTGMKTWEDLKLVSGLKIGPVDSFVFKHCPLPGISFKELMATVGIPPTRTLRVESQSPLRGTLTSRHLEGLHELQELNLHSNALTKLPEDLFKDVENLTHLNFSNNNVQLKKGIFRYVPKLEVLELGSNNINYLEPGIFRNLTKLRLLDLSGNRLQNLSRFLFHDIPNLESLDLSYNGLTTLPPDVFANLTKLKELNLMYSNLSSLPEDLLWGCGSLENLNLSNNRLVSLPESLFSSQQKLKTLDMSHNKLANISQGLFSSLNKLESLKLEHNKIKFMHPQAFEALKALKTINSSHNKLSVIHRGSNSILAPCWQLENIDLSYNQLSTITFDWRVSMVSLQTLNLSHNNFTYVTSDGLHFVANKLTLDLSNNKITMVLMDGAEKIAPPYYVGDKKVILKDNPFVCDCNAYHLVRYFRGELDPKVKFLVTIEGSKLACDSPEELKGKEVMYLDPPQLTCPIEKLVKKNDCPKNCSCLYRPSNSALLVNCSYRGLTNIPPSLPTPIFLGEWMNVNHTELDLTGNKIKFLPNKLGKGYSYVTKIYLSYNILTSINLTSFSDHLQIIELDHNNLTRFDKASLEILEKSKHIEKVSLENNPWICDCQTKTFLNFIQVNYKKIPNLKNLTCSNGVPLSELTQSELCPTRKADIVTISVTLAFLCLLIGGSIAAYYCYQREIKVWLYANKICLWFVTEEELDKDKLYDAFISYSYQDEKFVVEDLVPGLENGPTKFKLCLHYRDWVVGEFIPNQIARSVEESRRTVVVLSPNFLESVWGRMEFRTAHSQALSEGRARVIIILYGDIGPTENLDPELKAYLSMNTYVKWGDPWFWEKLRYALPHPQKLSKGIPLRSRTNIRRNSGEKLMNGTDLTD